MARWRGSSRSSWPAVWSLLGENAFPSSYPSRGLDSGTPAFCGCFLVVWGDVCKDWLVEGLAEGKAGGWCGRSVSRQHWSLAGKSEDVSQGALKFQGEPKGKTIGPGVASGQRVKHFRVTARVLRGRNEPPTKRAWSVCFPISCGRRRNPARWGSVHKRTLGLWALGLGSGVRMDHGDPVLPPPRPRSVRGMKHSGLPRARSNCYAHFCQSSRQHLSSSLESV